MELKGDKKKSKKGKKVQKEVIIDHEPLDDVKNTIDVNKISSNDGFGNKERQVTSQDQFEQSEKLLPIPNSDNLDLTFAPQQSKQVDDEDKLEIEQSDSEKETGLKCDILNIDLEEDEQVLEERDIDFDELPSDWDEVKGLGVPSCDAFTLD